MTCSPQTVSFISLHVHAFQQYRTLDTVRSSSVEWTLPPQREGTSLSFSEEMAAVVQNSSSSIFASSFSLSPLNINHRHINASSPRTPILPDVLHNLPTQASPLVESTAPLTRVPTARAAQTSSPNASLGAVTLAVSQSTNAPMLQQSVLSVAPSTPQLSNPIYSSLRGAHTLNTGSSSGSSSGNFGFTVQFSGQSESPSLPRSSKVKPGFTIPQAVLADSPQPQPSTNPNTQRGRTSGFTVAEIASAKQTLQLKEKERMSKIAEIMEDVYESTTTRNRCPVCIVLDHPAGSFPENERVPHTGAVSCRLRLGGLLLCDNSSLYAKKYRDMIKKAKDPRACWICLILEGDAGQMKHPHMIDFNKCRYDDLMKPLVYCLFFVDSIREQIMANMDPNFVVRVKTMEEYVEWLKGKEEGSSVRRLYELVYRFGVSRGIVEAIVE